MSGRRRQSQSAGGGGGDREGLVSAPETTWTGFDNQILGDSNGLRYTRQPRRIILARSIRLSPGKALPRHQRVTLGLGGAELKTVVQGYLMTPQGLRGLGSGQVEAGSGK